MKRIAGFLVVLSTLMVSSSAYAHLFLVETLTCDRNDAGTDDNIYVNIFGTLTSSQAKELDNPEDNFERGRYDAFALNIADIGDVIGVDVKIDGDDGWCFDWIKITDLESCGRTWTFYYESWLDDDNHVFCGDVFGGACRLQ